MDGEMSFEFAQQPLIAFLDGGAGRFRAAKGG